MTDRFDIAVVGAGPAGLAAAVHCASTGAHVVLVDSARQPGGQYWRHPDETGPHTDESIGQHDWARFEHLRSRLRALRSSGRITYLPGRHVWFVEKVNERTTAHRLHLTAAEDDQHADTVRHLTAASLVLCPGGYDRQIPIDGWDLPGVMAAGGVQALLKQHRVPAGSRAVVAGTGPFLLPVATALAESGVTVAAVCEANSPAGWLRDPRGTAAVPSKAVEAASYAMTLARHRIPYRTRTAITGISGDDQVRSVTLSKLDRSGDIHRTAGTETVDLVALGWGFTPSVELVTAVGAETAVDTDGSLIATVDARQRSTTAGVYVAGEATGVGGASLAVAEGELAGVAAAGDLGHAVDAGRLARLTRTISRARRFARAMAKAHPVPPGWPAWLTDDTTVCRCEEVTYGDIAAARDELDGQDARTVKLLTRPGMGWCQGRVCGFATARLAVGEHGRALAHDDLYPIAKRPLCTPVTLEHLASQE